MTGAVCHIDMDKAELVITRQDNVSLLIHVPVLMMEVLGALTEGELVHVTYATKSIFGNPFCYDYHLETIAQAQ